jgi:XTP/dITP diphosphohydrolase
VKELFVATGNRGKLKEIEAILQGVVELLVPPSACLPLPVVEEDGSTFEENAIKKARAAATATGIPALADDSGLVVDILGGRPGVLSARFAGAHASDGENITRLLAELATAPAAPWRARFVCVMALCQPDGGCQTFSGTLEGRIVSTPRGSHGFGYDPVFHLDDYDATLAELPADIKNRISHRAHALEQLKSHLAVIVRSAE